MAKDTNPGGVNRHKLMAMGKTITAMKKGGAVKADKAADMPMKETMKKGGMAKKKGK